MIMIKAPIRTITIIACILSLVSGATDVLRVYGSGTFLSLTSPPDASIFFSQQPTFSGSTDFADVFIFLDPASSGPLLGSASGQPDQTWNFTPPSPISSGSHAIFVQSTSEVCIGCPSAQINMTITADVSPSITSPLSGSFTGTVPTLSGCAPLGSESVTMQITDPIGNLERTDSTVTKNSAECISGIGWSIPVFPPLSGGLHMATAQAFDIQNHPSLTSNTTTFTVDALGPMGSISINSGDAFTSNHNVSVDLACSDGTGVGCDTIDVSWPNPDANNSPSDPDVISGIHIVTDSVPVGIVIEATETGNDTGIFAFSFSQDDISFDGGIVITVSGVIVSSSNGDKTVAANFRDAVLNLATSSDAIIVDSTAPSVTINSPATGAFLNAGTFAINGTAQDLDSGVVKMEIRVDSGSFEPVTSFNPGPGVMAWSTEIAGLGEGTHTITAKATNGAGAGATTSITVTIDVTPPTISITFPASNGDVISMPGGELTILGTASDENLEKVEVKIDDGNFSLANGTSSWSLLVNGGLSEGPHVVTAKATDSAGISETISANFIVNTIPPLAPLIISPASGTITNLVKPTIAGTAEPGVTILVFDNGVLAGTTAASSSNGTWSFAPSLSFADGNNIITAESKDGAGNTSPESNSVTVTIDTIPPFITAPSKIKATSSKPEIMEYSVTATENALPTCSPPSGSKFDIGDTTVTCTATDLAGNTGSKSFIVSITKPKTGGRGSGGGGGGGGGGGFGLPSDNIPPVIQAPADIVVNASSMLTNIDLGAPLVSDNEDTSPTITNNAPLDGFPIGKTTVTWTARDDAGNEAYAAQHVTVEDIFIQKVDPPTPRWDTDPLTVAGYVLIVPDGYSVIVAWGDGSVSEPVSISTDGTWGPVTHTYGSSSLQNNPNLIDAKLLDENGRQVVRSSPVPLSVGKQTPLLSIESVVGRTTESQEIIELVISGKLVDNHGNAIPNSLVSFTSSGSITIDSALTRPDGTYVEAVSIDRSRLGTGIDLNAYFEGNDFYLSTVSPTTKWDQSLLGRGGGPSLLEEPPVADAGPDTSGEFDASSQIILDGTKSSDPNGDPLTYSWEQIEGPQVALLGADTARPTFLPPAALSEDAEVKFRLTVSDGRLASEDIVAMKLIAAKKQAQPDSTLMYVALGGGIAAAAVAGGVVIYRLIAKSGGKERQKKPTISSSPDHVEFDLKSSMPEKISLEGTKTYHIRPQAESPPTPKQQVEADIQTMGERKESIARGMQAIPSSSTPSTSPSPSPSPSPLTTAPPENAGKEIEKSTIGGASSGVGGDKLRVAKNTAADVPSGLEQGRPDEDQDPAATSSIQGSPEHSKNFLNLVERLVSKGVTEQTLINSIIIGDIFKIDLESLLDDLKKYRDVSNDIKQLRENRVRLESEELLLRSELEALEEQGQRLVSFVKESVDKTKSGSAKPLALDARNDEKDELEALMRVVRGDDIADPKEVKASLNKVIELMCKSLEEHSLTRKILEHAKLALEREGNVKSD